MICSSFAIARRIYAPNYAAQGSRMRTSISAQLVPRNRWQVFTKLLSFPPRAGLPKLADRCKAISVKHGADVAWWVFGKRVAREQAAHVMRAFEQPEDQSD